MSPPRLLVADSDARSLGIVELALRKAGFAVETAPDGAQALKRIQASPPDVAILDAALPIKDAVKVCKALRADAKLAGVSLLVIGADKAMGAKAIDAGADDFLAKPVLLKELSRRAQALLERRQQHDAGPEAPLTGSMRDLGLIDALHGLEAAGRSAAITCEAYGRTARLWVKDGQVVDAEFGALRGEGAFWRLMTWESGRYKAELGPVDREARIEGGTQEALRRAMERVEELGKASGELPMTTQLAVDYNALAGALADLPDEVNGVVRWFDGRRTLREALDLSPIDDLSTLSVVRKLLADRILSVVESRKQQLTPKPSLDQWLSASQTPTPPTVKTLEEARAAAVALVEVMAHAEDVELQRSREQEEAAAAALQTRKIRAAVKPLALLHFPPLRGVRRERLRREAEEAKAAVGAGLAVRLSHVVELPPRDKAEDLGALRWMSPAVGEAAKKFAPDAAVARLLSFDQATQPSVKLPEIPKTDPEPVPLAVSTPPIAPVVPATPPPHVAAIVPTPPPDRGLEREMAKALRPRPRWPVYLGVAAVAAGGLWLWRQPKTDKKDSPWLVARKEAPPPAPAPTPPALVKPAVAVVEPPPAPPQVTAATLAPPADDVYAKALADGDELIKKGKYKAAVSQFQHAVRAKPQSVPALLALGDAYLEADKPRSAVQPLETAAKLDAQSARAQLLLGTAYQSLGKNPQAVKAYRRYIELEPSGEFVKDVRLILANLSHSG